MSYVSNNGACPARVYDRTYVNKKGVEVTEKWIDILLHKSPGCTSEQVLSERYDEQKHAKYRASNKAYLAEKGAPEAVPVPEGEGLVPAVELEPTTEAPAEAPAVEEPAE